MRVTARRVSLRPPLAGPASYGVENRVIRSALRSHLSALSCVVSARMLNGAELSKSEERVTFGYVKLADLMT